MTIRFFNIAQFLHILSNNRLRTSSTKAALTLRQVAPYESTASRRMMLKSPLIPELVKTRGVNEARA